MWKTVTGMGHTQGKAESSKRGEVEQSAGLSFCIRTQVSHRAEEKELKRHRKHTGERGDREAQMRECLPVICLKGHKHIARV